MPEKPVSFCPFCGSDRVQRIEIKPSAYDITKAALSGEPVKTRVVHKCWGCNEVFTAGVAE